MPVFFLHVDDFNDLTKQEIRILIIYYILILANNLIQILTFFFTFWHMSAIPLKQRDRQNISKSKIEYGLNHIASVDLSPFPMGTFQMTTSDYRCLSFTFITSL